MRSDDDRDLIEAIERSFRPEPMDAARRATFRRGLDARLARPPRVRRIALPGLAVAAAAAALWLAIPIAPAPSPSEEAAFSAFVDPDDESARSDDYLPEDYVVLASLLELDPADR
jgi:hypothetical protein